MKAQKQLDKASNKLKCFNTIQVYSYSISVRQWNNIWGLVLTIIQRAKCT